jgi:hypothetical protein
VLKHKLLADHVDPLDFCERAPWHQSGSGMSASMRTHSRLHGAAAAQRRPSRLSASSLDEQRPLANSRCLKPSSCNLMVPAASAGDLERGASVGDKLAPARVCARALSL